MAADLTSLNAALKQTWTESRLAEQLYQANPLLEQVKKSDKYQVGQQALTPIHTERNWGYTALPAAGGTLNPAGQQGLKQATWQYTHHNQQIALQGSVIDGTKSNDLSVVEALNLEVTGAVGDINRQLSRQIAMDGDALVAQCGTTTAANVVVLSSTGAEAVQRGWLGVGALIDIGTTASEASVAGARTITAVDDVNNTVTISGGTVTTSTSNFISFTKSRSGTTSYEMNGLGNIVSASKVLGGLDPATTPAWKSQVDSTSQALTLALMNTTNRKIRAKTGSGATFVLTSLKQEQAFYALLQANVRFIQETKMDAGNVEVPTYGGMAVHAQQDVKDEDMFFLTIADLLLVTSGDPKWQNTVTGGNILTWIQGTDSFGAYLNYRANLGARRRNSHAALRGLT